MHAARLALLFFRWLVPKACVAFQEPELHMWVLAELSSVPISLTGNSSGAQPSLQCSHLVSQPTAFLSIIIKQVKLAVTTGLKISFFFPPIEKENTWKMKIINFLFKCKKIMVIPTFVYMS